MTLRAATGPFVGFAFLLALGSNCPVHSRDGGEAFVWPGHGVPADRAVWNPVVAVNGRRQYWMSRASIPGGIAFENFELRLPFEEGQKLWFGITLQEKEKETD